MEMRLQKNAPLHNDIPSKSLISPQKPVGQVADLVDAIHHLDCLALMRSLPDHSVDLVFADPPFNLNKSYTTYQDRLPLTEYLQWTAAWLKEACRILKPSGSIFVYNIPRLLVHTAPFLSELAYFRHWIAWNSNGRPLGKSLQPAHYGILFYSMSKMSKFYDVRAPHKTCRKCREYLKDYGGKSHLRHKFGYQISDVWDDIHRIRHNKRRIKNHPCQLPTHLIERMILLTTDEGDVVFDPFCGSGSAAVAARQMGRRYIGAEIDLGYCQAAREKLERARPTKTDGIYASMYLGKLVSVRNIDVDAIS